MCEDCHGKFAAFGTAEQRSKRWCGGCANNHEGAVYYTRWPGGPLAGKPHNGPIQPRSGRVGTPALASATATAAPVAVATGTAAPATAAMATAAPAMAVSATVTTAIAATATAATAAVAAATAVVFADARNAAGSAGYGQSPRSGWRAGRAQNAVYRVEDLELQRGQRMQSVSCVDEPQL